MKQNEPLRVLAARIPAKLAKRVRLEAVRRDTTVAALVQRAVEKEIHRDLGGKQENASR